MAQLNAMSIAESILAEYWRLHPVEATHVGVHDFDTDAPDLSPEGLDARRSWRERSRATLAGAIDLDSQVLRAELVRQEIVDDEWQWPRRAPQWYLEQALNGVQYVLARPARPSPQPSPRGRGSAEESSPTGSAEESSPTGSAEESSPTGSAEESSPTGSAEESSPTGRGSAGSAEKYPLPLGEGAERSEAGEGLAARLEAISRVLADARTNLRGELVPPEYVEIALAGASGAQRFLADLPLPTEAAQQALAEFDQFLRNDLDPRGSFALGRDSFERMLSEVHGVRLSADDVYEHGRELAQQLTAALGPTWRAEVEALKKEHPTRETLLDTYAAEAARARRFVEERGLVDIPPGETFEVRPTAPFLRATMPLGHFDRTPPFSPTDHLGVLFITPIDPQLPATRQAELLEAHCFTAVRAICLHETFPGHHVQLWHAKLRGTPVRRQFASPLFTEGWALYCEEMMEEAGYYDSPALRLWRLKNAMWRAVRLMVDVGLHCRGLGLENAAQPLIDLGGLEPNTARGEALRYTGSPTQPSSYVLGRDVIVDLRRSAEQQAEFNLAQFHSQLLSFGSVPPAFIHQT